MGTKLIVHTFSPVRKASDTRHCLSNDRSLNSIFLCPLTLELSFYRIVFKVPLSFVNECHPYETSLGRLPFGVEKNSVLVRHDLLKRVCQLSFRGFPDPPARLLQPDLPVDEGKYVSKAIALQEMATAQLDVVVHFLLWRNDIIYGTYTRPTLIASTPRMLALYYCWKMRRNAEGFCSLNCVFDDKACDKKLDTTLQALAEFLADKPFFGGDRPNYVDARAFSYLAVIFSMPLKGTVFLRTAAKRSTLTDYCSRMNEKYNLWRDEFFMAGVKVASNKDNKDSCDTAERCRRGVSGLNILAWSGTALLLVAVHLMRFRSIDNDPLCLNY